MKRKTLSWFPLALALVAATGCSRASDDSAPEPTPTDDDDGTIAEYYGYEQINATLRTRMMRPDTKFELKSYLSQGTDPANAGPIDELTLLLGSYDANGLKQVRQNGIPNAFNIVLWNVLLSAFASDLGAVCTDTAAVSKELADAVAADVASLCTWPSPASKNPDLLQRFWTDVMGFDAPPEEFRAFKDAFSDPEFAGWAPADVVAAMTRAILLNPHFLLRK